MWLFYVFCGFWPDKTRAAWMNEWMASKTFLEKRVSREFITIMLLLEISDDDVLSNMPLPDYCTNGIENFSRCVFHNCTINLVQK